ncbi:hypothetical protein [Sphingomonas abietis]|uniref:Uncharacterized protein n=1 Tax=Sphingomonas abietis TaxID=3012344 RepID=A0ABY7NRA2_9SPHN|nr:hypothetical protein [Sphingomonas abietis]WBO23913.1 hypothetical protein PBT88_07335 [Sphingomonas abietis]
MSPDLVDRYAARAEIYLITGDDHLDDPAWGIVPIWTGTVRQAIAWLLLADDISQYSVVIGDDAVWAKDFLAADLLDREIETSGVESRPEGCSMAGWQSRQMSPAATGKDFSFLASLVRLRWSTAMQRSRKARPIKDGGDVAYPSKAAERHAFRCFIALTVSIFLNFALAILNQHGVGMDTQKITILQALVTVGSGCLLFARHTKLNAVSAIVLTGIILLLAITNLTGTPNIKTLYDCMVIPLYVAVGASAFHVRQRWMNLLFFSVLIIVGVEFLAPTLYTSLVNPGAYFTATREWIADQSSNKAIQDGLYIGAYRGGGSVFSLADHRLSGPFLEPLSLGYFSILMAVYYSSIYRGSFFYRAAIVALCAFLALLSDSRAASLLIVLGGALLLLRVRVPIFVAWITPVTALIVAWLIYYYQPQFLSGDYFYRIGLTFDGMDQVTIFDLLTGSTPVEHMNDSGYLYLIHCVTPIGLFPLVWYCCGLFTRRAGSNQTIFFIITLYATTTLLLGGAFFSIKTASLLGFIVGIAGLGAERRPQSVLNDRPLLNNGRPMGEAHGI